MTMQQYDPELWPYAPGNAPADVEAALQREAEKWPEPTVELRDRITAIFRQAEREAQSSA